MTEQNCEQFLTISWEEINLNKATLKPASQLKKNYCHAFLTDYSFHF